MDLAQKITGIFFTSVGLVLLVVSFFFVFALIYAIPVLIIGVLILFNVGKEKQIEKIKKSKR
jgi:ABC-type bacteriocin/lantibiotic exporter with double-glycine peptidase domain